MSWFQKVSLFVPAWMLACINLRSELVFSWMKSFKTVSYKNPFIITTFFVLCMRSNTKISLKLVSEGQNFSWVIIEKNWHTLFIEKKFEVVQNTTCNKPLLKNPVQKKEKEKKHIFFLQSTMKNQALKHFLSNLIIEEALGFEIYHS